MNFRNVRPRGQISAAELRELAAMAEMGKPSLASGASVGGHTSLGGTAAGQPPYDVFAAQITALSGTDTDTVYSFEEVDVQRAGTDQGKPETRSGGRFADKDASPARYLLAESTGDQLKVDDFVFARRSVTAADEWEILGPIGAVGADWKMARVTATAGGDPPSYTCVAVHLTVDATVNPPTFAWADVSPTVTYLNCLRAKSRRWDEQTTADPALRPIPVGQYVLVRRAIPPAAADPAAVPPTYAHDGAYELTPWGGTRGVRMKMGHGACSQCVDTGGGVFKIRTKLALAKRSLYARDLVGFLEDPADPEVNFDAKVPGSGPEE